MALSIYFGVCHYEGFVQAGSQGFCCGCTRRCTVNGDQRCVVMYENLAERPSEVPRMQLFGGQPSLEYIFFKTESRTIDIYSMSTDSALSPSR